MGGGATYAVNDDGTSGALIQTFAGGPCSYTAGIFGWLEGLFGFGHPSFKGNVTEQNSGKDVRGTTAPSNISCNTKLPNGKTVGDYVRAARTQMNSITGTGSPPLDAYHMLTTFKGLVGGGSAIDFKNTMAGQAPLELLGNAGNFAYYATGSGYFSAGILDMGASGYALKSAFIPSSPVKFSALTMPYGQDTSAKLQEGPGLAANGCGVKKF